MTNAQSTVRDIARHPIPTEMLVAIDFSTAAWSVVPLAVDVAARCAIPIRFVHIDTASPWMAEGRSGRLRLHAAPGGRSVDVDVVPGSNVPEAIQAVRATSPESVVALATHGRNGLGELALGSVCEQLLNTYDATVLAVGPQFNPDRNSEIRRVVICHDSASTSAHLLDEGVAWAEKLEVPLTVLSVSCDGPTGSGRGETYQAIARIFDGLPQTRVPVIAEVLNERDVTSAIVRYADRHDGTLLVLATHARRPLVRAMTHSVARHVAHEARCAMLLCRATTEVHVDPDQLQPHLTAASGDDPRDRAASSMIGSLPSD